MAQLMETLMSAVPHPSVVCPTHCSPAHHAYLSQSNPPLPYPSPPSSQTTSNWTDTPTSLPPSPLRVPQQQGAVCHMDPCSHRAQDLHLGHPAIPSTTPLPSSSSPALRLQTSSVIAEPHLPSSSSSPLSSPGSYHYGDGASVRSRVYGSSLQDGGDESPHLGSGCFSQSGLTETYKNQTTGF